MLVTICADNSHMHSGCIKLVYILLPLWSIDFIPVWMCCDLLTLACMSCIHPVVCLCATSPSSCGLFTVDWITRWYDAGPCFCATCSPYYVNTPLPQPCCHIVSLLWVVQHFLLICERRSARVATGLHIYTTTARGLIMGWVSSVKPPQFYHNWFISLQRSSTWSNKSTLLLPL